MLFNRCFFTPLRLSDYKQTRVKDEDDDVAAERQRIYDGGSKSDILMIRDLSKVKDTYSTTPVTVHNSQYFNSMINFN